MSESKVYDDVTDARSDNRQRVLEACMDHLARHQQASMSELARTAGIGRATLNRYFSSRAALMQELALLAIARTNAALEPLNDSDLKATTKFERLFQILIPLGDCYHFLSMEAPLMSDQKVQLAYRKQLEGLHGLIEELEQQQALRPGQNLVWLVYCVDSLIYAAWTAVAEGDLAINQAARIAFDTIMSGIARKPEQ